MRLLLVLVLLSSFNNCTSKENKPTTEKAITQPAVITILNYDSCKKEILLKKRTNKPKWGSITKTEKERIFTAAITETIIPAWIGTAWDFNGISETPQQGNIACGYFVTTILRDGGLSLARIKLAQCASEQMITSLVQSKYIHRFSNVLMEDFFRSIQKQGFGLYIVGLDNHTGFIYNDGIDIYFIHSTFVGTRNVQKEKAVSSPILIQSRYKVLGKISADDHILQRWIN